MKTFDDCNWAVCYDIPGSMQDDGKPGRTVCAWFDYPFLAEEFIEKVLPAETRERFYILHRDDMKKAATPRKHSA